VIRAFGFAVIIAFSSNAARLMLSHWLYPLNLPRLLYHDIPNYFFFLSGWSVAFAIGLRWLRADFVHDTEAA